MCARAADDFHWQAAVMRAHAEATLGSDPGQTHRRFAAGPAVTIGAILVSFTRQFMLE